MRAQPVQQFVQPHRLGDEVSRADADIVVLPLVEGVGRDDGHGRGAQLLTTQRADGLPAVDAGHRQVHQDGVHRLFAQQAECGRARARLQHVEAQPLQTLAEQRAIDLFVVHHQHPFARAGITSTWCGQHRRAHAVQRRQRRQRRQE